MADTVYTPRTVRIGNSINNLTGPLLAYFSDKNNNIDVARVHRANLAGYAIPEGVLRAVKRKVPGVVFREQNGKEKEVANVAELVESIGLPAFSVASDAEAEEQRRSDMAQQTRDEDGERDSEDDGTDEDEIMGTNSGDRRKRKRDQRVYTVPRHTFKWLVDVSSTNVEPYNRRTADGKFVPLTDANRVKDVEFDRMMAGGTLPDDLHTAAIDSLWDVFMEVNGKPFYDAEENALGSLPKSHYLILPADFQQGVCEPAVVGLGLERYAIKTPMIAAIYVLARNQAIQIGYTGEKAVKWACLRLESVKAGWFDDQAYVRRMPAPADSILKMEEDTAHLPVFLKIAWQLSGFVPLVAEYHFRQRGSSYNKASPAEFTNLAMRLARAAGYEEQVKFIDADILYGEAFRWIGMKRPIHVVKAVSSALYIPNVFHLGKAVAPAGQAILVTSAAIIARMKQCNWWESLVVAGNYDSSKIERMAEVIAGNPWKYHLLSSVYGEPSLTEAEQKLVDDAKVDAKMLAPILQAFMDVLFPGEALGKAKALLKHAKANPVLHIRAQSFFRMVNRKKSKRKKSRDVTELSLASLFAPAE